MTVPVCTVPGNINNRRRLTVQNYDQGKYLGATLAVSVPILLIQAAETGYVAN